jgi:hypothetical protein
MSTTAADVVKMEKEAQMVDLRLNDLPGMGQHLALAPVRDE